MVVFVIIGVAGLALLLFSMLLGEFMDFGDGVLSGTALGSGATIFGALGAIATANDLPIALAYVGPLIIAVGVIAGVQYLVRHLRNTEDGVPVSVIGMQGTATTDVDPRHGEVSLESAQELERRLAWADEPIPAGSRIVVVEQSGSKVRVRQHFPND